MCRTTTSPKVKKQTSKTDRGPNSIIRVGHGTNARHAIIPGYIHERGGELQVHVADADLLERFKNEVRNGEPGTPADIEEWWNGLQPKGAKLVTDMDSNIYGVMCELADPAAVPKLPNDQTSIIFPFMKAVPKEGHRNFFDVVFLHMKIVIVMDGKQAFEMNGCGARSPHLCLCHILNSKNTKEAREKDSMPIDRRTAENHAASFKELKRLRELGKPPKDGTVGGVVNSSLLIPGAEWIADPLHTITLGVPNDLHHMMIDICKSLGKVSPEDTITALKESEEFMALEVTLKKNLETLIAVIIKGQKVETNPQWKSAVVTEKVVAGAAVVKSVGEEGEEIEHHGKVGAILMEDGIPWGHEVVWEPNGLEAALPPEDFDFEEIQDVLVNASDHETLFDSTEILARANVIRDELNVKHQEAASETSRSTSSIQGTTLRLRTLRDNELREVEKEIAALLLSVSSVNDALEAMQKWTCENKPQSMPSGSALKRFYLSVVLRENGIKPESHWGHTMTGGGCQKYITRAEDIFRRMQTKMLDDGHQVFQIKGQEIPIDELAEHFLAVTDQLKVIMPLGRTTRRLTSGDIQTLDTACKAFGRALRKLQGHNTLTPKAHTIACGYFVMIAREHGRIGKFSADGCEAFHQMTCQYRKLTASAQTSEGQMKARLRYFHRNQQTERTERVIHRRKKRRRDEVEE